MRMLGGCLSLLILFCFIVGVTYGYPVVDTRTVVAGLQSPTELLWGPTNDLWLAERGGTVSRIDPETGIQHRILSIPNVFVHDGAGLLGMAFHPNFSDSSHVFVAYTYIQMGVQWHYYLRVNRYRYDSVRDTLVEPVTILDRVDAGFYGVGGKLLTLPDRTLLLSLGDGLDHSKDAGLLNSARGKTLRINFNGSVPQDNPWWNLAQPYNLIWTRGHRDVEGMTLGPDNTVYATDVGAGVADEINALVKGRDYGWLGVNGYCDNWPGPEFDEWRRRNAANPVYEWYRGRLLAVNPAGIAYYPEGAIEQWRHSLLIATLDDGLYQLELREDNRGVNVAYHYLFSNGDKNRYGALRAVCVSPSGRIFVASTARSNGTSTDQIFEIVDSEFEPHSDGLAAITTRVVDGTLQAPWQIASAKDSTLWLTERPGYVVHVIPSTGQVQRVADLRSQVTEGDKAGLLGIALHPNFPDSSYIFLTYTYGSVGVPQFLRLTRYRYDPQSEELIDPLVLIDSIQASTVRNGGRLEIGTNSTLLLAVGDGEHPEDAQQKNVLGGKIVRIGLDGSYPPDNPFSQSTYPRNVEWAAGVRSPQGLALAPSGLLYGVDLGGEGNSELNIYYPNGNYGWPFFEGYCQGASGEQRSCIDSGAIEPINLWGDGLTASGIVYYGSASIRLWNNSLLVAMLDGQELRQVKLSNDGILVEASNSFLKDEFGRLRDVCVTNDGRVFVITGNTHVGEAGSDQLIEVNASPDTTIGDESTLRVRTVVEGLDTPWEIVWGPDEWLWITERAGVISRVNPKTGEKRQLLNISPDVHEFAGSGMLGMALHPDFDLSPYVYVVYTYSHSRGTPEEVILERLERYRYDAAQDTLVEPLVMLDSIEANIYHDGSRLMILPDHTLMMTTGDAANHALPQDHHVLNGKSLRMNFDGTAPADNPWPDAPWPSSLLWSTGHRNSQGLAIGLNGLLYSSEHGDDADDELNILYKGRNYGYPYVQGICDDTVNYNFDPNESVFCGDSNVVTPLRAWTPTLGVCGLAYYDHEEIPEWRGSLLLVTLGIKKPVLPLYANTLIQMKLAPDGRSIEYEKTYFTQQFGRLRAICIAPNGRVFIASSNEDSRGEPRPGGDRILEIRGPFSSSVDDKLSESLLPVIAPNPVSNQAIVDLGKDMGKGDVRIYDVGGNLIRSEVFQGGHTWRLVRNSMRAGFYLIEVSDSTQVVHFQVIVE